jgi:hypothetical protein
LAVIPQKTLSDLRHLLPMPHTILVSIGREMRQTRAFTRAGKGLAQVLQEEAIRYPDNAPPPDPPTMCTP